MTALMPHSDKIGAALLLAAETHPEIVLVLADSGSVTGTAPFRVRYPERTFEMGIAEQNMVLTAAGLAASGKIPFAAGISNFVALRCAEQIRTFVAHTRLNVKIVGGLAGLSGGKEGATHLSCEDLAHLRSIPELTIVVPSDANSAHAAILAAVEWQGPIYLRIGRGPTPLIYGDDYVFRIGRADQHRPGRDLTIVSTGQMLGPALAAADDLASRGVSAGVLNLQTLKPLDEAAILDAARQTGAIVTAEEHTVVGGLGGAVAELLSECRPTPVVRFGIMDTYAETGKPEQLFEAYGLTSGNIVQAAERALALKASGATPISVPA